MLFVVGHICLKVLKSMLLLYISSQFLVHCMMFTTTHDENERSDVMMQIKVHKVVKTHSVRFFKNFPLTIFCAILAQNLLIN